ncbi:MAG: S8 family serine peptidase [Chloroflexota bacterium]
MPLNRSKTTFIRCIFLVCVFLIILTLSNSIWAQDEMPTDATVTDIAPLDALPTDITPTDTVPTELPPTDAPTVAPPTLEVAPTDVIPTQQPTTEVAITEAPTTEATADPTLELSPSPTVEILPSVFNFSAAAYDAIPGLPLTFQFSVSNTIGTVRIVVDESTTGGSVEVVATDAVESAAPFNTSASVTYLAAATFSGSETLTFTAIDASGNKASATVQVNVAPAPTLEPTLVPTAAITATHELLIDYNPAASEPAIQAMLSALNAVEVNRIPQIGAMRVLVPDVVSSPVSAMSVVTSSVAAHPAGVSAVEVNTNRQLAGFSPNDPDVPLQWGLGPTTSGDPNYFPVGTYVYNPSYIGGWDMNAARGKNIIVAVVDTGIDLQHPEFVGQLVPGWDFVDDDNMPDDDFSNGAFQGHGTHVSGVIAAKANNGMGIAGIAYNAKIMPIRVCNSSGCSVYYIAAGIVHAVDHGARVINISIAGCSGPSTTEQAAINYALSRNVVVVVAAGNGASSGCADPSAYAYPASYPGVISVAAHDINGNSAGNVYGFNHNDRISVSAPGIDIFSTVPLEMGSYQGGWSGTSMASPHVAGIAALIMSANVATTPAAVREALICGAIDSGAPGKDDYFGYGVVQGDYGMNWRYNGGSCHIPQPNDNFENATPITAVPFTATTAVDTRSVTTQSTDPMICGAYREQTLWYKFVPTVSDYYQVVVGGSIYSTYAIYQGNQGALNQLNCGDSVSKMLVGLTAGQTYYIAAAPDIGFVNDEVQQIWVWRAMSTNNTFNEENSPFINYIGGWSRVARTGASGGFVQQTSDYNDMANFAFRGTGFELYRTIGPTMGTIEVYVDGGLLTSIYNRAAYTQANQSYYVDVGGTAGTWHQVEIRRAQFGSAGAIELDRIRTFDAYNVPTVAITAITDDRAGATRFSYTDGFWSQVSVPGSNLNTVTQTSDVGAKVTFRATGSTITIYRNTYATFGDMVVFVDGIYYGLVSNSGSYGQKVPYVVSGLTPITHVVQIVNQGILQFDAAQGSTPAVLPVTTKTDDRSLNITYGGLWTNVVSPGALTNTTRYTSDLDASVSFDFTGNYFCVGYKQQPTGGQLIVYIDGAGYSFFGTDGPLGYASYCTNSISILPDQRHSVRLAGMAGPFEIDYIQPMRQAVITPAMGLVQETNAAIYYDPFWGPWYLGTSVHSLGGYAAQGGSMRYTSYDNARLSFYINGTGLILYTAMGPSQGEWEVWIDGLQVDMQQYGFATSTINMYSSSLTRWRPLAYGITNLPAGVHRIELRARIDHVVEWDVDFDGVRVFP